MLRRVAPILLLALIWMVAGAGRADAHAILLRSLPGDGARIDQAPTEVVLSFDEEVLVGSVTVSLHSGSGEAVHVADAVPSVIRATSTDRTTEVRLALPPLGRGSYRMSWRAESAEDLHPSAGTVVFGVGDVVAPHRSADRSGPAPDASTAGLRWLQLVLLGGLIGAALLALVVLPRAGRDRTVRRRPERLLWTVGGLCAALGAVVGVLALADASHGTAGAAQVLTGSAYGFWWAVGELAWVVLALVVAGVVGRGWTRGRAVVGAAGLSALLAGLVGGGHVTSSGPVVAGLLALHLAAAAAWTGGLLLLLPLCAVLGRDRPDAVRAVLRAFGVPAAASVGILVTSGAALTGSQVASVDALLTTTYGRVLVAKAGLAALAGLLGLATHRRLRRAGAAPVRPRILVVEAAVLLAVLGGGAVLAAGTPARGPAFAPTIRAVQPRIAAQTEDLFLTADLSPNTVGQSWLRVGVDQTRRPVPAPVTGVSVTLTDPSGAAVPARELRPTGQQDRWELPQVDLGTPGTWQLRLAAHRPGRPDVVWDETWTVPGGPLGDRAPVLSDRPWALPLDLLAVLLGLATAGAVGARLRRRTLLPVTPAPDPHEENVPVHRELVRSP